MAENKYVSSVQQLIDKEIDPGAGAKVYHSKDCNCDICVPEFEGQGG